MAKPAAAGLTQGAPPGIPTLESQVKAYLKEKYHKPGNVYLGIPHRLDRPVSGVVVFARNSKAADRLAEQFRDRKVVKVYWGAVEGAVEPSEGVWEDWLRKIPDEARSEKTEPHTDGAKLAELRYRVLQACVGGTLLEFHPLTGRMHQIRLGAACSADTHCQGNGTGSTQSFGPPVELPRERIIALHARSLTFLHPIRYEPIMLVAPLPAVWTELGISVEAARAATESSQRLRIIADMWSIRHHADDCHPRTNPGIDPALENRRSSATSSSIAISTWTRL